MRKQYIMDQPLTQIMCALFYWRPNQKITREIWIQASLLHANYQHLKRFVNRRSIWRTPKSIFTNRVLGWHQLLICMILILGCQFCTATGAQLSSKEVLQQVAQSSFLYWFFASCATCFCTKLKVKRMSGTARKKETFLSLLLPVMLWSGQLRMSPKHVLNIIMQLYAPSGRLCCTSRCLENKCGK